MLGSVLAAWAVFIEYPWAALVPALVFQVLWLARFHRGGTTALKAASVIPVVAWVLYALYEWRMKLWSETVIAPIRIDLLIVIPALAVLSGIGVMALAHSQKLAA